MFSIDNNDGRGRFLQPGSIHRCRVVCNCHMASVIDVDLHQVKNKLLLTRQPPCGHQFPSISSARRRARCTSVKAIYLFSFTVADALGIKTAVL